VEPGQDQKLKGLGREKRRNKKEPKKKKDEVAPAHGENQQPEELKNGQAASATGKDKDNK
jgi:hypothetical protein